MVPVTVYSVMQDQYGGHINIRQHIYVVLSQKFPKMLTKQKRNSCESDKCIARIRAKIIFFVLYRVEYFALPVIIYILIREFFSSISSVFLDYLSLYASDVLPYTTPLLQPSLQIIYKTCRYSIYYRKQHENSCRQPPGDVTPRDLVYVILQPQFATIYSHEILNTPLSACKNCILMFINEYKSRN